MTVSEELFEQHCRNRGVKLDPILTAVGKRTADYRIWLGKLEVIIEVKQIEPGALERQLIAQADDDDSEAVICDVHNRIRNEFDKAKSQLKNLSNGVLPSIFILYDNTKGLSGLTDEAFLQAMHGDEVVELELVGRGANRRVSKWNHRFGHKRRKVGPSYNRSVSAFSRLFIDKSSSIHSPFSQ